MVINDLAPIYGTTGCSVFNARTVTGIDADAPTPSWMASRLRLAGMRPISIVVDVSNYVMLELGQPNHCYDASTLDGAITVRRAFPGRSSPPWTRRSASCTPRISSSPTIQVRSASQASWAAPGRR